MEKTRFGKTELMVSKAAFGGIPIMRLNKEDAVRLIKETINLGINFIDTAHGYADSEEKIGEGIRGMKREDIIIATKSPADDRKTFNEHLELSLKRLGTDYIDIMQLHNIGSAGKRDKVFASGGAYEGLQEAVKAGKVRFPGFSSHSNELCLETMKTGKFDVVQFPFNFIDDAAAKEIIPLAKEMDLGFIAMKPMGGGKLDNARLSFRYLMQFDSIVPDPGIEKIEEIREITDIISSKCTITEDDKMEIEKLRAEYGGVWCHRCDYCQPCPQGIDISWVLSTESCEKRFTLERFKLMLGQPIERARTCLECGRCKERCPYRLDIPALLKENIKHWEKVTG
ncbi:MAG: aldo/keto reductase [Treponema sp.]|jgi:predicted aldo/keto reductase-like oxidoreductase|nr:aldo/keto reductase [Treponema sp.]